MRFKQWVDENGVKLPWLAKKLGIEYIRVHRLYHGAVRPELVEVDAIRKISKKAVTFEDWLEAEREKSKLSTAKEGKDNANC